MDYQIYDDKIVIKDSEDFIIEHILDCGQVFRYSKQGSGYFLVQKNKNCLLHKQEDYVIITTDYVDEFVKYFDLERDYSLIKAELSKQEKMYEPIEFGKGLRLLNQDPYEMIISFIISANNNIPRIKSIIEKMCVGLGKNMGDYYAFPTLKELQRADVDFFRSIGAGYRAEYLVKVAQQLNSFDFNSLYDLDTQQARKLLVSLMGVGNKVADCILLFGYKKVDTFPVDTWSKKVYNYLGLPKTESTIVMESRLVEKFGQLSGYAQQYLFYYYRQMS